MSTMVSNPPCVVFALALALFALGALLLAVTFPISGSDNGELADSIRLCRDDDQAVADKWVKRRWPDYNKNVTIPVSFTIDVSLLLGKDFVPSGNRTTPATISTDGVRLIFGKLPVGAMRLIPAEIDSPISWWPIGLNVTPPNDEREQHMGASWCDCAADSAQCTCHSCALLLATATQQLPLSGLGSDQCAPLLTSPAAVAIALQAAAGDGGSARFVNQCDQGAEPDVTMQLQPEARMAVVAVQRDTAMARVHLLYTSSALCVMLMIIVLYAMAKGRHRRQPHHHANAVRQCHADRRHSAGAGWLPLAKADADADT